MQNMPKKEKKDISEQRNKKPPMRTKK